MVSLFLVSGVCAQERPYFDARKQTRESAGDRAGPGPTVHEVLIGYFGPNDSCDPDTDLWTAAQLAIEEGNRTGGYQGKSFRLVQGWAENPWTAGVAKVAHMAWQDRVWAIIGGMDGPSTHLAEQIAAKALLPLVSPVSTDKTVNYAGVPWVFSCMPSDDQWAPLLAEAVVNEAGKSGFVLLAATDHDSHLAAVEFLKSARRLQAAPLYKFEFKPGDPALDEIVEKASSSAASAFVVLAGPEDSARIADALLRARPESVLFGGPSFSRSRFSRPLEDAQMGRPRLRAPLLCDDAAMSGDSFFAQFLSRTGHAPDCAARQTYDAARMVIQAIRKAGLNRARIRDELEKLSPWEGVAGKLEWDRAGQNHRDIRISTSLR